MEGLRSTQGFDSEIFKESCQWYYIIKRIYPLVSIRQLNGITRKPLSLFAVMYDFTKTNTHEQHFNDTGSSIFQSVKSIGPKVVGLS